MSFESPYIKHKIDNVSDSFQNKDSCPNKEKQSRRSYIEDVFVRNLIIILPENIHDGNSACKKQETQYSDWPFFFSCKSWDSLSWLLFIRSTTLNGLSIILALFCFHFFQYILEPKWIGTLLLNRKNNRKNYFHQL